MCVFVYVYIYIYIYIYKLNKLFCKFIHLYRYTYNGRNGIVSDFYITLQESKYIILIFNIMIQKC